MNDEQLASIDGWLSLDEGRHLMELASQVESPNVMVELGSYEGRSSCFIAEGSRRGHQRPLYCVDLWDLGGQWETDVARRPGGALHQDDPIHWERFRDHAGQYADIIVIVKANTRAIGQKWIGGPKVGLLFIDAGHSYDDVYGDLEAWVKHVHPDGVICVHDYANADYPDVQAAVNDFFREVDTNSHLIDSMVVIRQRP